MSQSTVAGTVGNHAESQAINQAILDGMLRDCCLALMADYGLPASQQDDAEVDDRTAVAIAAIDFSGRDLRGTIALRMTTSVVLETYRAAVGTPIRVDSPEALDWTCELANQLVGRLKNKLRNYQVSFSVNTPRLLQLFPVAELERALRRRFVCDGGNFAGYLDVMIASGFVFSAAPPEATLADEGDLVLF
jgi:Chemotaxis phosphatase CheX